MATKELIAKLPDIPLVQPGFGALDITAPVLVSLNPDGKWQKSKPDCLDEDQLKAVVSHLVNSKAVSAVQSYCCQCAAENGLTKYFVEGFELKPDYGNRYKMWEEYIPSPGKGLMNRNNKDGNASNYVPVIMMSLYPADKCPFDMDCEIQKMKETEPKKKTKTKAIAEAEKEDKEGKKKKKRGFVMQRLNDFDLLSQW